MKRYMKRVISIMVAVVFAVSSILYPTSARADNSQSDFEIYEDIFGSCVVEKKLDETGNAIIHVKNEKYGLDDVIVLEVKTKNIVLNGEVIGYFIPSGNAPNMNENRSSVAAADSTWNYLGTSDYKITATGSGITTSVLTLLSGIMGGTVAATIIGGLAGFVGTATTGGTLTVKTWDRWIGSEYYQKYNVKFTTSTGEVWGPVDAMRKY